MNSLLAWMGLAILFGTINGTFMAFFLTKDLKEPMSHEKDDVS